MPKDAISSIGSRNIITMKKENVQLKPSVKWAGGKGQLLNDIIKIPRILR